jgi:hypothetical protein
MNAAEEVTAAVMEGSQPVEAKKEKYWDAVEVQDIARRLMAEEGAFAFPTNTMILYLFVDKMKDWGQCSHCSEKIKFAGGYEFIIVINYTAWSVMDDRAREALVFHQLMHITFDPLKDKYSLRDHDLEEFSRVVSRYGLWTENVKRFMDAGMKAITVGEDA